MPGLHNELLQAARAEGVDLVLGMAVPWLSGRGHLNVQGRAPCEVVDALANIHTSLGGDAAALALKRPGNPPTPDLVHVETGCLVEVDEVQHFTTARETSLRLYPTEVSLGFDPIEYTDLIQVWRSKADRAYAHKRATDFPFEGGRQAQRAYNDALRDMLAPTFTGFPVIRIPVPSRSMERAVAELSARLEACR